MAIFDWTCKCHCQFENISLPYVLEYYNHQKSSLNKGFQIHAVIYLDKYGFAFEVAVLHLVIFHQSANVSFLSVINKKCLELGCLNVLKVVLAKSSTFNNGNFALNFGSFNSTVYTSG